MLELSLHRSTLSSTISFTDEPLEALLKELGQAPGPRLLCSDAHVARAQRAWLDSLHDSWEHASWILPAGDTSKNSANLLSMLAEMHRLAMGRDCPLVAFGGGMCGDLSALAASLWKRGVPFYFVPTSLLAMVDASVGGKTGINFGGVKNSVGSFYPARHVWIHTAFLKTLPQREWASGFGELLKMAWLDDDAWAQELEESLPQLLDVEHAALSEHIRRAVECKARVVSLDLEDRGPRRLLNLGHSFAHALEAESEGEIAHGQAVLIGMLAAVLASARAGLLSASRAEELDRRLMSVIRQLEIEWPAECDDVDSLMEWMKQDKKNEAGELRLILLAGPGHVQPGSLGTGELRSLWQDLLARFA